MPFVHFAWDIETGFLQIKNLERRHLPTLTLLQTAKANCHEPAWYLAVLIERLPYYKDLANFEALLLYTRVN